MCYVHGSRSWISWGWKCWSALKSMMQLLGLASGYSWFDYLSREERACHAYHNKVYRGSFFSFIILTGNDELHECFILLYWYQIDRLLPWFTHILIFMPRPDYLTKIMLGSVPHQKKNFVIYLLEDEQELSLGMMIHLRRIYNFLLFHANILLLPHPFGNNLYDFLGITYWSSG